MPVQAAPKPAKPNSRVKRQIRRETSGGGFRPGKKLNMNKHLTKEAWHRNAAPNRYILATIG
jgi:hypothetical protein